MYQEADVRKAIRDAVQRGNDGAAWNTGYDRDQMDGIADDIMDDMVPVEPDYEAAEKAYSRCEPSYVIVNEAMGIGGGE